MPRTSRLVLGAALALVLAMSMSSCGGTDYVYAGSQEDHVFFRVPSTWALYDTQQMLTAERVNDTPAGGRFKWIVGYDSDPNPSINHLLLTGNDLPKYPVVYAYVKALGPGASDQYSVLALRNDKFPIERATNEGSGDYVSYPQDVSYPGGYFGQKTVFTFYAGVAALQVNEIAVTDPGFRHVYMLTIFCDSVCYKQNQGMIEEIARTWTLKEF